MKLSDFPDPTLIPVNGVELEVFEAGRENAGNPVVLCHGWPGHASVWRHQVPALVAAGYHVIVPNQRGYGNSSRPADVTAYDIGHLSGDLVALLDHFGYDRAVFVGHDWGASVVWGLTLLHPDRVDKVINLSLPYQERGEVPWIELMEAVLGGDFYFVHFNRQPGVADAVFDENTFPFLRNLYRKNEPPRQPQPGMAFIDLARAEAPLGEPVMSDEELDVLVSAFETSGFTGGVNWYRKPRPQLAPARRCGPDHPPPRTHDLRRQRHGAEIRNACGLRAERRRRQSRLRALDPAGKARRTQRGDRELAATTGRDA